jgi:Carboxypeptidase regulatory-like domain
MIRFPRTICAVGLLILFAGATHGQSSTGSISGIVTDQNQAVIAAATVSIRNTATGFTRSTITTSEDHYSFRDLPIGAFRGANF